MPRAARNKSSTGIYHIILKEINRQRIFKDKEDNQRFLEVIKTYRRISGYEKQCLEYNYGKRLSDIEAVNLIQNIMGINNPKEIQTFEKQKRNEAIKELRSKKLSIRQIERITGISLSIIRNL